MGELQDRLDSILSDICIMQAEIRDSLSSEEWDRANREHKRRRIRNEAKKIRKTVVNVTDTCGVCGTVAGDDLQMHHIEKVRGGGTNDLKNLIMLCDYCHKAVHKGESLKARLLKAEADNDLFWAGVLEDMGHEITRVLDALAKMACTSSRTDGEKMADVFSVMFGEVE